MLLSQQPAASTEKRAETANRFDIKYAFGENWKGIVRPKYGRRFAALSASACHQSHNSRPTASIHNISIQYIRVSFLPPLLSLSESVAHLRIYFYSVRGNFPHFFLSLRPLFRAVVLSLSQCSRLNSVWFWRAKVFRISSVQNLRMSFICVNFGIRNVTTRFQLLFYWLHHRSLRSPSKALIFIRCSFRLWWFFALFSLCFFIFNFNNGTVFQSVCKNKCAQIA